MKTIWLTEPVHPLLHEQLTQAGWNLLQDRPENGASISGIVVRNRTLNELELERYPHLQFIARAGVGMDNIDLAYALKRGISCFNAGEANAQAVAEHALGLLVGLIRHQQRACRQVKQGIWLREENRGRELKNLTVGIIGWGNTGSAFGHLLLKLGCRVLAFDKYKIGFGNESVGEVSEEELLQHAELISLHVPLTDETRGYYNSTWLKRAQSLLWLINTSRGDILNLAALKEAIENNSLMGAALDVLPEENPVHWNDPIYAWLQQHPNIILTPHIAGWTKESYEKIARVLVEKINHYL